MSPRAHFACVFVTGCALRPALPQPAISPPTVALAIPPPPRPLVDSSPSSSGSHQWRGQARVLDQLQGEWPPDAHAEDGQRPRVRRRRESDRRRSGERQRSRRGRRVQLHFAPGPARQGKLAGVGDVDIEQLETKVSVSMKRYQQPGVRARSSLSLQSAWRSADSTWSSRAARGRRKAKGSRSG